MTLSTATGPSLVMVIRHRAVPNNAPSRPTGACFTHGPAPPGPQSAAWWDAQIAFSVRTTGWHAAPGATGTDTTLELKEPEASVLVAVFTTSVTVQAVTAVVLKHTCGGSPTKSTTRFGLAPPAKSAPSLSTSRVVTVRDVCAVADTPVRPTEPSDAKPGVGTAAPFWSTTDTLDAAKFTLAGVMPSSRARP
ncbi:MULTISPECIES: hypothetical protein [unclassified Saccharothrix]|uniref:hypothetical protein n=1 Tax=unclassified Saccharothrix TaxID=2593673 RepID=UPI00307EDF78